MKAAFDYMLFSDDQVNDLANLAQQEIWDYKYLGGDKQVTAPNKPILRNYLDQTIQRLSTEKKIVEQGDKSCFNTGLVTKNQEEIFCLFEKNTAPKQPKWRLRKICKQSDRELLVFNSLPNIAHYFDDPKDLLYDTRLELRANVDHIVEDNIDRFPEHYKSSSTYQLRIILDGAIEQAKKRIKRNYKTAIPQFYRGKIQLLLPLCLITPSKADLALVVEKYNDIYLASTCLTLNMAYNNARVLAKLDTEWLEP